MQVNELETILKKDPRQVTIELVREKLNGRFARIKKSRGRASDNDHEKALNAVSQCLSAMSEEEISLFVKQFKGLCIKCGKFGHKGADCQSNGVKSTDNTEKSPGSFNGKCYFCGFRGHRKADCKLRKQKQEMAAVACSERESQSSNESFDELGFVAGCEGIAQPSENSRKHVSFCDSVRVKEFSPECNIGDGQIRTSVLDGHSRPRMRKRKIREVHDQEGEVMGKIQKMCLFGNSEPPDEMMCVTSEPSFWE